MSVVIDSCEVLKSDLREKSKQNLICSLEISGGFLAGQRFEFAQGLNCVIGGRGAGKTSLLELIRYALDAFPKGDRGAAERRRLEHLVNANLAGGRVQLTVQAQDGLQFVISRAGGEEPVVLTLDGQPTNMSLKSPGFFRLQIYSQNELETIAERCEDQLVLLDSLACEQIGALEKEILDTRSKLRALAAGANPLMASLTNLDEELALLPGIEEKLRALAADIGRNPGSAGALINEAHQVKSLRDRERRSVNGCGTTLKQYGEKVSQLKSELQSMALGLDDADLVRSPNKELLAESANVVQRCVRLVDQALDSVDALVGGAVITLRDIAGRLSDDHQRQELQFQSLLEQDQAAQQQAVERSQLERRRNGLLTCKQSRATARLQLDSLLEKWTGLLTQLSLLEESRYAVRDQVVSRINERLAPRIRVSISQFGNTQIYQQLLERLLKTAKLQHRKVSHKIAERVWRNDLTQWVRDGKAEELAERAELKLDQAEKVVEALADMQSLFELDMVELPDEPKIELLDGEAYKESHSLSTGQKCTSVLPILLLGSEYPLLVDQPDDNLDNRFVYDTVVGSVRRVKQTRQLLFITHNPNIPVLGDAERVFVLESNGKCSQLVECGTVDECRENIVSLLEGGEEAFMQRRVRYAY